jgi:hypothetical protein
MLKVTVGTLAALVLALAARGGEKEDKKADAEAKVAAQKKAAEVNWDAVEAGPVATHETKHLVLIAPKPLEKRLKEIGTVLERAHEQALKPLAFDAGQEPYPGKIMVYLFANRDHFRAFVRRVEKKRVEGDEAGGFAAKDEDLHAAATPARAAGELSLEGQAAAQLGSLLLTRRAGLRNPVPDWLVEGFGRATWYRVAPRDKVTLDSRRQAARLAGVRSDKDIYSNMLESGEGAPLRGSLAEFLAYGPLAPKLSALLKGFEPDENGEPKTTDQALDAAGLTWSRVNTGWKAFALVSR